MTTEAARLTSDQKEVQWTPGLIRRLRGKRTLVEFADLIGVAANTVWRWEDGRVTPDSLRVQKLSALAIRERFLSDWKLAGSMILIGDIEIASQQMADTLKQTLKRRAAALSK
jgi:DNA-binding transcriptional regulator YiaG